MSSAEELKTSIEQYKEQVAQINNVLETTSTESERASLITLLADLQELLTLTQQALDVTLTADTSLVSASASADVNADPFADEMRLFMEEVNKSEADDRTLNGKIEALKKELNDMIGKKCLAPHRHAWGSVAYHNAFVCGLDDTIDEYNECDFDQIKVRVLFTNPTHQEMIPCGYYLDGDCRFDASKCRFSHGELVLYTELKDYQAPDFSLLAKINSLVLVKQSDRIWHKARIVSCNANEKLCVVKLERNRKEIDCQFEDILPISSDETSTDSPSDTSSSDDEYEEIQRARLIEQSLLTPVADQALGEWEKHTKGFGSKMMQKYGYVLGTGLGQNGEGIIVPISAQILPPGRSLDHCMTLREGADGDRNLFSVERKLKQIQRKQEANSARAYERERQNCDLFSFINENVFANPPSAGGSSMASAKDELQPETQRIESHSTKSLNVTGFKIGEDIRKKEREIQKVKESLSRHKNGTPVYAKLKEQLMARNGELERLKRSEKCVAKEQVFRKNKSKMSVF